LADVSFLNIQFLWALFTIPIMVALHFFMLKYTKRRAIIFANFEALKRVTGNVVLSKNITILIARILIILFLTLSAAGMTIWMKGPTSEFNYVIAVDTSSSMLADDFTPNRLIVAKQTAQDFVNQLNAETKIGVVSFSGISKVDTSITNDKKEVNSVIDKLDISSAGGTDISGAIITSVNILMSEPDKSRAVIVLTDGQQTIGSPLEEGINYATSKNTLVHTIGIATEKGGKFEMTQLLSTLDETALKSISDNTGGKYFRVADKATMDAAFKEIVKSSEQNIPFQLRLPFLIVGILLLFLEWVLINTRFRTLP